MKINIKLLGIICLSTFILISCNKDSIELDQNSNSINGLRVISYNNKSSNKSKGMAASISSTTIAVFNDLNTYNDYIDNLDNQVSNWENSFLSQWGHLDDDALNAKEDELGFDSEKPLTDFENQIGLQSLRQRYLNEEAAWLNNDVLDESTDPDNKPEYNFDESEMTVLNLLSEVQIGTTIYKKLSSEQIHAINDNPQYKAAYKSAPLEDGAYLEIENEDYDALIEFNDGNTSVIDNDNVNVNNSNSTVSCKYGKSKRRFFDTAPGKKIKAIIKVPQPRFGWNGKVKAKIKSYKKRNGRGWRKWRTNIAVGARGNVYDTSCNNSPYYIDNQWTDVKKRRKMKFKWHDPYYVSHIVENGGMTGLYKQNGIIKELPLTW